MAEALSPADRSALAAERGPVNMTVAGVMVFPAGPAVTRETLAARLSERVHLVRRLRQRLQEPAMGLANPLWVDDRDFDLDWHVRSTTLAEPGDDAQLGALVGREVSRRLDRSRPLWEVTVIEGLEGGERIAVLFKLHHALTDGMAAIALGAVLLDPTPEPMVVPQPEDPWEPQPFALRRHLTGLARQPFGQAQRLMLDTVGRALDPDPRRAASDLRRATQLLTEIARNRPQAPMTPLNEPISANRRFALARVRLDDVKAAGRRSGATVNDVILAAIAGMLRRYLQSADAPGAGRPPVALVPVSVREETAEGELGNRISTVLVDLPTDVEDPIERLQVVGATMRELKDSAAVRAGALVVGAAGLAPPLVSSLLARAMSGVRAFNLVVSNLPGPQQPFYLGGAPLLEVYPVVPLNPSNQGLSVGVLSYDGGVFFGLLADRDLDPPLDAAALALHEALAELLA